jgi:hypothetical protein
MLNNSAASIVAVRARPQGCRVQLATQSVKSVSKPVSQAGGRAGGGAHP